MSTTTATIKDAACATLLLIIKHYTNVDLQFDDTIKQWLSNIKLYSKKGYLFRCFLS